MLGSGDCDVEPALASIAIEGPKVHRNSTGFVGTVTNRKENHVALIALNALKILHENRFALNRWCVTEMDLELRILAAFLIEKILDQLLLGEAKGHYTVGTARTVCLP